jgi:hypothetical protein
MPAVAVIAAQSRNVLADAPEASDDELRDLLKSACAKHNLQYDAGSVAHELDRAQAQRQHMARPLQPRASTTKRTPKAHTDDER